MGITVQNRAAPSNAGTSATPSRAAITPGSPGNVYYAFIATLTSGTNATVSACELGAAGSGKTFTPVTSVNNNTHERLYIYRYVIQPGDSETTVTATQSGSVQTVMAVYELSSVDTTTFEAQIATGATGSAAGIQSPSLSSSAASGDVVFALYAVDAAPSITNNTGSSGAPTTGWTTRNGSSSTVLEMSLQDVTLGSSQASAHGAIAWTGAQNYATTTIEVLATTSVPVNQIAGTLTPTGAGLAGTVLTATAGTWSNDATTYTYTWKRGSTTIKTTGPTAATSDTYTTLSGDIGGGSITCLVAATNTNGTSGNTTDTGTALVVAPAAPVNLPAGSVRTAFGPPAHHCKILLERPGATPIDLTRRATSLTWTTVIPGGYGSATLVFAGDRRRTLPHLATLRIYLDQRVLFEGRIETPEVEFTGDGWTTTIQAYGKQRLLDETSVRRLWVMGVRDLDDTTDPVGDDGSVKTLIEGYGYLQAQVGNYDPTDTSKFGLRVTGVGASNPTGAWAGARIIVPAGMPPLKVSGVLAGNENVGVSSYSPFRFIAQGYDGANATPLYFNQGTVVFNGISGQFNQAFNASWSAGVPASTTEIRIGWERQTADSGIFGKLGRDVNNLRVYGTSLTENSDGTFYGGAILTDLVNQVPGLTAGNIETGTDFAIPEIERTTRSSARNVVDEVAGYYRREWAVWEDGVFSWETPVLDETQWIVQTSDGIRVKLRTDTDPMANKTIVTYTDPSDQRQHEASVSSTSNDNPYVRTGQAKDDLVQAPAPLTAATAALLAAKLNTDRGTQPVSSATITIPAALMIARSVGPDLPAYCIRAGENIRVADAPSSKPLSTVRDGETLFHVISTSCDGEYVTLECDGYQPSGDALLARLTAVTRAVTG